MPKSGRHGSTGSYNNGAAKSYTSAAIPSKKNPFSFLSRCADSKPLVNSDDSSTLYQQSYQAGYDAAGYANGLRDGQAMQLPKMCQTPYKPFNKTNKMCDHDKKDVGVVMGIVIGAFVLLFIIVFVCAMIKHIKHKIRDYIPQKRSKRDQLRAEKIGQMIAETTGVLESGSTDATRGAETRPAGTIL
ncbi:MAG: hypothetical protein Q9166_006642 [cf. Caloplaca sp. 2 TL-2023]